jgi:hypothetical protein
MRQVKLGSFLLLGTLLLLAIATPAVACQRPKRAVQITAEPRTLQLQGELENGDLTGTLRLRASSALAATDYYFLVQADLKGRSGTIGREQVTITEPVQLPARAAQDFTVTVSRIKHAGTYTGTLQVIQLSNPRRPLTVGLVVKAERRPAPKVTRGTPLKLEQFRTFGLRELRTGWRLVFLVLALLVVGWVGYSLWRLPGLLVGLLAFLLVSLAWRGADDWTSERLGADEEVGVDLDNPVSARLPIVDGSEWLLRREIDGRPAGGLTLQAPGGRRLADWDPVRDRTLYLRLDPAAEHPGHYEGQVLLRVTGIDTRFAIPVQLDIRVGPFLPLMVLMLSILAGFGVRRLVRDVFHRFEDQASIKALCKRVEREVPRPEPDGVANELAERLVVKLTGADWLVGAGDHESAHKDFAGVAMTLSTWNRIKEMRAEVHDWPAEVRTKVEPLLKAAEVHCCNSEIPLANAQLDYLAGRLWAWEHLGPYAKEETATPEEVKVAFSKSAMAEMDLAEPAMIQAAFFDGGGRRRRPPRVLRFLVLWITRPVFYTGLVVALSVTALKLFYLNNPTFGVRVTDWLPLIGWGIATDPVSTALSNLRRTPTA